MLNSSNSNNTPRQDKNQVSQPEPHLADAHARVPLDGYVIVHRQILDEGFPAYDLSFLITCLLIAEHKKTKTPGVVAKSTTELGRLMGASQKRAWKCKRDLIARGIIKPLAGHKFVIVNYEDYQNLVQTFLVPQTKNITKKGHNFSPTDLPLVAQTNGLVPQASDKSHRLMISPTDYSPDTNQLAELTNKRSNITKEVIVAPPTSDEVKLLDILRDLKGWRYEQADDLAWLRDFTQEFTDFALAELRAARDYYSGKPVPKHKGGWKNRFRNWMLSTKRS